MGTSWGSWTVGSDREFCLRFVWGPLPTWWLDELSVGHVLGFLPVTSPSSAQRPADGYPAVCRLSGPAVWHCQHHIVGLPFVARALLEQPQSYFLAGFPGKPAAKGPATSMLLLMGIPCYFLAHYWHDELLHLSSSAPDRDGWVHTYGVRNCANHH